jgi:tetratricopeptide (TPR) repeat protein
MILAALLILAQPAAAAVPPTPSAPAAPRTLAQDRLDLCMDKARNDPTTAIAEASAWERETRGVDASEAQQCLGVAYTALLRWQAAERAFLAARDATPADDAFRRAQLATMAGNAALAEGRGAAAQVALEMAAADAELTGNDALRAMVHVDLARALVLQGDATRADAALARARELDPQSPFAWLLSATLARRLEKLDDARKYIETAAALAPDYAETALEAGVIAMLSGDEDAARKNWSTVIALEPDEEAAATARGYLIQLDAPPAEEASR